MKYISRFFKLRSKVSNERGASLVEYGLLIALIAVVAIPSVRLIGNRINQTVGTVNYEMANGSVA